MKQILFLIIAFVLCFAPCLAQNASAKVKGIVVDWQNARVLATIIVFQNKQFRREITVNPDGEYEIELPVGSYVVKAQRFGFRQYRFKSLKVVANETRTLNIELKYAPTKTYKCPKGQICL
ncbi:MAG: carboxypeptidase-like regulatory domain-containing protein [Segetibacter sp.]